MSMADSCVAQDLINDPRCLINDFSVSLSENWTLRLWVRISRSHPPGRQIHMRDGYCVGHHASMPPHVLRGYPGSGRRCLPMFPMGYLEDSSASDASSSPTVGFNSFAGSCLPLEAAILAHGGLAASSGHLRPRWARPRWALSLLCSSPSVGALVLALGGLCRCPAAC